MKHIAILVQLFVVHQLVAGFCAQRQKDYLIIGEPDEITFKVSLLAATVMLAVGCQKEEAPKTETTPAAQTAAAKTVEFKSEDDKAAYAIGVSFANYLKTSIEKPSEIGIDLNKDLVLKGIEHVFAGNPEMSEEETRAALEALDKRVAETMQAKAAEKQQRTRRKAMSSAPNSRKSLVL